MHLSELSQWVDSCGVDSHSVRGKGGNSREKIRAPAGVEMGWDLFFVAAFLRKECLRKEGFLRKHTCLVLIFT